MRKAFAFTIAAFVANRALADSITDGIGVAGDAVYGYMPYVQALGFVIACIFGIVAALQTYYAIANDDPRTKKKILRWCGGCVAMLAMTISLPKFFSYQESGLDGFGNLALGGESGVANWRFLGGDRYARLDTEIPDISDPRWQLDPRYNLNITQR